MQKPPTNSIIDLAHQIIDEWPSRASRASEIIMWAGEIRERHPGREEFAALVDPPCKGYLPDDQRELPTKGLRAFVRFAE
jgi:hypothetical protein